MRKAVVFSVEALLALAFAASVFYSGNFLDYGKELQGFLEWRAKLVAEDVARVLAEKNLEEGFDAGEVVKKISAAFPNYCISASLKNEVHGNCGGKARNAVSSDRVLFDGERFSEVKVMVYFN